MTCGSSINPSRPDAKSVVQEVAPQHQLVYKTLDLPLHIELNTLSRTVETQGTVKAYLALAREQ